MAGDGVPKTRIWQAVATPIGGLPPESPLSEVRDQDACKGNRHQERNDGSIRLVSRVPPCIAVLRPPARGARWRDRSTEFPRRDQTKSSARTRASKPAADTRKCASALAYDFQAALAGRALLVIGRAAKPYLDQVRATARPRLR